jgi:hypothetical protein
MCVCVLCVTVSLWMDSGRNSIWPLLGQMVDPMSEHYENWSAIFTTWPSPSHIMFHLPIVKEDVVCVRVVYCDQLSWATVDGNSPAFSIPEYSRCYHLPHRIWSSLLGFLSSHYHLLLLLLACIQTFRHIRVGGNLHSQCLLHEVECAKYACSWAISVGGNLHSQCLLHTVLR